MNHHPIRVFALLALVAGICAASAQADNFGRETFPHEQVTTTIAPADDVDDFVFEGGAGFKLTAGVKSVKGSLLAPVLELVGPDGDVLGLADGVTAKPPKKNSAALKAVLPVGGTYALRVRGQTVTGQTTFLTPWEVTVQSADVNSGADTLGLVSHGLLDGDQVQVTSTTDTLPGGLVLDGTYFVVQSTTNTFKVSAISGGTAVDILDSGAGTMAFLVTRVPEQIDFETNTFEKSGHGLANGDLVRLLSTTDTVPGGLSLGTDYYVVGATAGEFQVAALPGGAAIDITDNGAGILTVATTKGTTGACTLKWKLTPAKVAAVKGFAMTNNQVFQFGFPARGGALVSWSLKWKGDGVPSVIRILDPDNKEVPYDTSDLNPYLSRKIGLTSGSESGKKFPLPEERPGGQYKLEVKCAGGPATVGMSIKVALPKLKALPVTLTQEEPVLESINIDPIVASTGVTVELTGRGLDSAPQGVLFGPNPATDVVVTQGATANDPDTVTCTVPVGSGTVPVQFVSVDGEVSVLPDTFTFRPMPVISSFTPELGPGGGGIELTITGSGFETLQLRGIYDVRINNVPAWPTSAKVTSPSTLVCKIPANPSGPQVVEVRNVHSNAAAYKVQAPGYFTYTTSLSILYLDPTSVPANFPSGMPVTVFGAGLNATDTVFLENTDGGGTFTSVPTTPVYFGAAVIGHRIEAADLPQRGPGSYAVKVESLTVPPATRDNALSYYSFVDDTAGAIPAATSDDDWGGVSNALMDNNQDGEIDVIVVTHSSALTSGKQGTRILVNDGTGDFDDMTATAMPSVGAAGNWGANRVLAGNFTTGADMDIFLSRPGTGTDATKASDKKSVVAWSRILLGGSGPSYTNQSYQGGSSKFFIPGTLVYGAPCYLFDFDFRGVNAAMGDLDGDLDSDVLLVNNTSLTSWTGTNCTLVWQTCMGYYTSCYAFSSQPFGSATRICTMGSTGGVFDRTKEMLKTPATADEDFRAVAAAIGDMNADFLNDIVITHNTQPGGSGSVSCTRGFRQKVTGSVVTYNKMPANFMPPPSGGGGDDWRGDAVAVPDLNVDLYRDLVISMDGPVPGGGAFSTRILVQDPLSNAMVDQTAAVLTGVLPAGDAGYAKFILPVDIDRDNDTDLIICTPTSAGAGNRMTRLLLNAGKDVDTGLPILVDGSSLLPPFASDDGAANCVSVGDVDGDGDLDIVVTNSHQASGPYTKRTRIWKQQR
jgi:hypothetical protein